jgi:hypothetical protein
MFWITGLLGATSTVLVTTLDDSVWLLPFVGSNTLSKDARLIHAAAFVATLVGLSISCCIVALAVKAGLSTMSDPEKLEIKLEALAVLICWSFAFGFAFRKFYRKRQRLLSTDDNSTTNDTTVKENGAPDSGALLGGYGSVLQDEVRQNLNGSPSDGDPHIKRNDEEEDDEEWVELPTSAQPWTVATLTAVGFLDEISYFPALVIGNVFSVNQLCLGTLLAALIMLSIQVFLARQCQPLIKILDDNVPLYGIIALFATLLTIHLVFDIFYSR